MISDAGGLFRLSRKLPCNVATEIMLTGKCLRADEAQRLGLVAVIADDAMVSTMQLAGKIAQRHRLLSAR